MSDRRIPTKPNRPSSVQEIRSQLALELLLNAYAIGGALIIFRTLLKVLEVGADRWVGKAIYGVTNLVAFPLTLVPGSGTHVVGDLTLADATLLAVTVLFPLGLFVYGSMRDSL